MYLWGFHKHFGKSIRNQFANMGHTEEINVKLISMEVVDRSLQLVFSVKNLIQFNLHVWSTCLGLANSCEAHAVFPKYIQP